MPTEVTDPALLAQLNGGGEVTDPALLATLNGTAAPAQRYSSGAAGMYDAIGGDQIARSGSPAAVAASSPVSGNDWSQNMDAGVGSLWSDASLAMRQMYAQIMGNGQTPALEQTALAKRATDAPLLSTGGGRVGQFVGALPLAAVPGANTYLGAGIIGGGLGALRPTVGNESRVLNTGVGAGVGLAGQAIGNFISNWATGRAAQPLTGWRQATGNQAAADAVGSDADALTQPAIAEASARFNKIFGAARNPDVAVQLSGDTASAVTEAAEGLNQSSRAAFEGNAPVNDLMAHLREGTANAEQLGKVSSDLGREASAQMSQKMGDRALGRALFDLKDHVDDLVGGSITDPAIKAAYDAARPQYRAFMTLTARPTILNSATGDVNLRNLGSYLQKSDRAGYLMGGNTSPLYEAARFGQATRLGPAPSPPILQPVKWLQYHMVNNPVIRGAGGLASRGIAPIAPAIQAGLPALAIGSTPVALSYIEQ